MEGKRRKDREREGKRRKEKEKESMGVKDEKEEQDEQYEHDVSSTSGVRQEYLFPGGPHQCG